MTDLEKLNPEQRKAVTDTEGAVLVFAGAGSGKTRVLTHRIAYLIDEKKINPWNILAITFTNKATREMKERLTDMLGENDVWVSTFHSLCVSILHKYAQNIGYTQNFTIYDETASKRALLKVLREKRLEEDDKDTYAYHIGKAKNAGLNSDEYFARIRAFEKNAMLICEVYDAYERTLFENNAMDFDDLLIKCYRLLSECDEALEFYSRKFKYIHVDEFQDTNLIQFELLKLLASKWKNIFVVGDDDQSIYGWRGADVRNILEFDRAFPELKIYKLEQNYRSTQQILDCANRLISNNKSRTAKTLYSEKKDGVKVEYLVSSTEYEEVDRVTSQILALKRQYGYSDSDFAVLVRNNALTRLYETNFKKSRIPYKVYGGYKFFDRKEILDVIAYIRMLVNEKDSDAITRIINFPPRGIGDTTVDKLINYSAEKSLTLFDTVMDIDYSDFTPAIKSKVGIFRNFIGEMLREKSNKPLVEFICELVVKAGFEKYYRSTGKEEDLNRWENIEEFLTFLQENYEDSQIDLGEFLQTLALSTDADNDSENVDSVVIATMHAAKGLEFKVVFIIACEEGIIPSSQSIREANGIEEERRVMYVALTRAQERLYVSAVRGVRRKYNRTEPAIPSRFFSEAKGETPQPFVRNFGLYGKNEKYNDSYETAIPEYIDYTEKPVVSPVKTEVQVKPKVYNTSSEGYKPGAKVEHRKYGKGTVITVSGSGTATTVTVAFPGLGVKKFALMNAPLTLC